jgi:hypothetical protein
MKMGKNYALIPLIIVGALIVTGLVAGNIFFKDISDSVSGGFSFTNPFLWIIGFLVLVILLTRRR